MKSRYKIVDKDGIYFCTSSILNWLPVFTRRSYFDLIADSLAFCRENKSLQLFGYVIMDNHIHLIAGHPQLGKVMQDFKSFTARKIIDQLLTDNKTWLLDQFHYRREADRGRNTFQIWQAGYHPKLVAADETMRQKLEYMHNNPVKAGFVESPEHWIYSSASNYLLGHGVIEVDLYEF